MMAVLLTAVIVGLFFWWGSPEQQPGKTSSVSAVSGELYPSKSAASQNAINQSSLGTNLQSEMPVIPQAQKSEELVLKSNAAPMEEWREKLNERRELAQLLQKRSAGELLSKLETLWGERAIVAVTAEEKTLIIMALTLALHSGRENSNEAVYQKLSAMLRNESLPRSVKGEIASMLGSVQRPVAVQLLLGEYHQTTDASLREILGKQIARTGDDRVAGQFREDLSPSLESAWSLARNDPQLAQAAALGLAKVGTAAGVQLLINEVLRAAPTVEGLYDLKDAKGQAAFLALAKVRNPNAIAILSTGLLNANSSEVNQYVCGLALAAMGRGEATQVLLQWAVSATDQDAAWAEQWFGKLRDTASFELVAATLNQPFSSDTIRNAVALGQGNRKR